VVTFLFFSTKEKWALG